MIEILDRKILEYRTKRDSLKFGTIDWLNAAFSIDCLQHLRKEVFGDFLEPYVVVYVKPKHSVLVERTR
jgi:hypothetical protein